jgi:hypothetical protein
MKMSPGRVTWGLMFLWLGVMLVVDEKAGVGSIGAGVILLIGAAMRKAQGRRAGAFLPLVGVLLVIMGINDLNGDDRGIPFLATALIALGALVLVRAVTGPKVHSRGMMITFGDPDDPRVRER